MTILQLDESELFGTEGSGHQKKIWLNGSLIKLDSKFKESEKEVYAAKVAEALNIPHAQYNRIEVLIDSNIRSACITPTFLTKAESEISMRQIIDYYEFDIPNLMSAADLFANCVDLIYQFVTENNYKGLVKNDIKVSLLKMTTLDYLICNSDRHFSNFGIIVNAGQGTVRMCPLYDHGQSFLLCTGVFSHNKLLSLLRRYKSRPFSTNPDKNIIDFNFAYRLICESELNSLLVHDNSFYSLVVREQIKNINDKMSIDSNFTCYF